MENKEINPHQIVSNEKKDKVFNVYIRKSALLAVANAHVPMCTHSHFSQNVRISLQITNKCETSFLAFAQIRLRMFTGWI